MLEFCVPTLYINNNSYLTQVVIKYTTRGICDSIIKRLVVYFSASRAFTFCLLCLSLLTKLTRSSSSWSLSANFVKRSYLTISYILTKIIYLCDNAPTATNPRKAVLYFVRDIYPFLGKTRIFLNASTAGRWSNL